MVSSSDFQSENIGSTPFEDIGLNDTHEKNVILLLYLDNLDYVVSLSGKTQTEGARLWGSSPFQYCLNCSYYLSFVFLVASQVNRRKSSDTTKLLFCVGSTPTFGARPAEVAQKVDAKGAICICSHRLMQVATFSGWKYWFKSIWEYKARIAQVNRR